MHGASMQDQQQSFPCILTWMLLLHVRVSKEPQSLRQWPLSGPVWCAFPPSQLSLTAPPQMQRPLLLAQPQELLLRVAHAAMGQTAISLLMSSS